MVIACTELNSTRPTRPFIAVIKSLGMQTFWKTGSWDQGHRRSSKGVVSQTLEKKAPPPRDRETRTSPTKSSQTRPMSSSFSASASPVCLNLLMMEHTTVETACCPPFNTLVPTACIADLSQPDVSVDNNRRNYIGMSISGKRKLPAKNIRGPPSVCQTRARSEFSHGHWNK